MIKIIPIEWVATATAVVTGSGTAAGISLNSITIGVALVGAFCAVCSTIAAIYFHHKNYKINEARLLDERREVAYQHKLDNQE